MTHGQPEEAEQVVRGIEAAWRPRPGRCPVPPGRLRLRPTSVWFGAGMVALVTSTRRTCWGWC